MGGSVAVCQGGQLFAVSFVVPVVGRFAFI